jgi:aerobic-type carbon monoxide dehydrogenase small subunit (CoxS/CutS family)
MLIKFTLNGDPAEITLKSTDRLLADVLREDFQLTGTKLGCGIGACGICTVIVNGEPTPACLQLAAMCDGADIRTIEGLATADGLHPVQQAFVAAMRHLYPGACNAGVLAAREKSESY